MKIGIVSLGLIGGSLFKCIVNLGYEVYAVTRNKETINQAKELTANVSNDINNLKCCDIVFVASPISKTLEILDKLEEVLCKDTIVLDCASVKEFVMEKKRPYKFIGSHPMAGTEFNGYNSSFKELFQGAKWILTPSEDINEADIKKVSDIINRTGADIVVTNAKEHDMAAALISHMPMLISQAIFETAQDNQLALLMASSGFRDMTRLAMSNIVMANDMMNFNKANIEKCLEILKNSVDLLKSSKYLEIITDIKNKRSNMYSDEGKNIIKLLHKQE